MATEGRGPTYMSLELVLKIFGWIMVLTPIAAYIFISANIIIGAAKDDGDIRMLAMLFLTCFGIGGMILVLTYLSENLGRAV